MDQKRIVEQAFDSSVAAAGKVARLRIHTSDQSIIGAQLEVELNGQTFTAMIPEGYGFQDSQPARLA